MRGSLKLFADVVEQETTLSLSRRGRSNELIARRDECLINRYHYYLNFFPDKRPSYQSILEKLCDEFYIAPITIAERIEENYDTLMKLKAEQPTKNYFVKKWPHLTW